MHPVEKAALALRHAPLLEKAHWLWNSIRPLYERGLKWWLRGGLIRCINGTDTMLIVPELHSLPEAYESAVWPKVMAELRPGDRVADIGASLGLYTIAMAKRVGSQGRVYAFEPDAESFRYLQRHVSLNHVDAWVEAYDEAVGDHVGRTAFVSGQGVESHIVLDAAQIGQVSLVPLDAFLAGRRLDVCKIDVEGFEEFVLRGALQLLNDPARAPRAIFIEVHPYAWPRFGVSDASLLGLLAQCRYQVGDLTGARVSRLEHHGEIVACRVCN